MERVEKDSVIAEPIPESLADSAGFLLNRTSRILQELNEEALGPLKLAHRELGLLRILDGEGPVSQHVIGRRHNIDRTTVVQIVDTLEARDLVTRVSNQSDRRSNLIYITPRGKKTMAQAVRLVNKVQSQFLSSIQPSEWELLRSLLSRLIRSNIKPN